MATINEVLELHRIVQQQAELILKQVEDAKNKKEANSHRQNEMFDVLMLQIMAKQEELVLPIVDETRAITTSWTVTIANGRIVITTITASCITW